MYTRSKAGFTLIEMMITLVVLAVLAAVAIPSYSLFVERARRSEAREALSDIAARQEQFFSDNKFYATNLIAVGATAATENGYYAISIPVSTSLSYTLRATAQAPQTSDTDCTQIDLTSTRIKTPAECW